VADDRLQLIRASLRRIERETRIVKRMVAQELDERDKATNTNDSPGGHTNEHDDEGS
jgi:hypothetical protein